MKKIISVLAGFILMTSCAIAGEDMNMPAYQGSAEFEQIKKLAGAWQGKTKMGEEEKVLEVQYQVTSNGSAVIERLMVGEPNEMVTVYYDKGDKLAMMHYCSLGNRPEMELISSSDKEMMLSLMNDSPIDAAKETHMHALKIDWIDEDHITQSWTLYQDGQPAGEHVFELTRVK